MWKIPAVLLQKPCLHAGNQPVDHPSQPRDLLHQQHIETAQDIENEGDKKDKAFIEASDQAVDL